MHTSWGFLTLAKHSMKFQSHISKIQAHIFSLQTLRLKDVCYFFSCACSVHLWSSSYLLHLRYKAAVAIVCDSHHVQMNHIWIKLRCHYSIFWSLIFNLCTLLTAEATSPWSHVSNAIKTFFFWLNQILDSISASLLPNKPTEPHVTEIQVFSFCSFLWAEVELSALCVLILFQICQTREKVDHTSTERKQKIGGKFWS